LTSAGHLGAYIGARFEFIQSRAETLIASKIRTGRAPKFLRAIRLVPHGKQAGMASVNLRGSMVEIDPYKDDLFRKVIEQRKLNKSDKALYYWLKVFANSIYGFFVELLPELQTKNVPVGVFSGEKKFPDSSDVIEKPGTWFFPPLAALITSAGRLLLAMTEACVQEKQGTYLFCDTDSLAIVSSKDGCAQYPRQRRSKNSIVERSPGNCR
jgi:DNA polymerase elongation subunit (family B)